MNKWQMNTTAGIVWPNGGGLSAPDNGEIRHMSIHPNGRRNAKKGTTTAPIKERPYLKQGKGSPHNVLKGGKRLRKALQALRIRVNDAEHTREEATSITIPGSMKG